MLDEQDLTTYARGMAGALKAIGPTPRDQVAAMLRALQLTEDEAHAVVAHGLRHGILVETEGTLELGPAP